jgi:hypothetical protein
MGSRAKSVSNNEAMGEGEGSDTEAEAEGTEDSPEDTRDAATEPDDSETQTPELTAMCPSPFASSNSTSAFAGSPLASLLSAKAAKAAKANKEAKAIKEAGGTSLQTETKTAQEQHPAVVETEPGAADDATTEKFEGTILGAEPESAWIGLPSTGEVELVISAGGIHFEDPRMLEEPILRAGGLGQGWPWSSILAGKSGISGTIKAMDDENAESELFSLYVVGCQYAIELDVHDASDAVRAFKTYSTRWQWNHSHRKRSKSVRAASEMALKDGTTPAVQQRPCTHKQHSAETDNHHAQTKPKSDGTANAGIRIRTFEEQLGTSPQGLCRAVSTGHLVESSTRVML